MKMGAFGRRTGQQSGIALLLTLAFLVLLAFMIFGLLSSMWLEREISYSYGEQVQTRWVAETALADALAHLAEATPPAAEHPWVVAPGMIYWLGNSGVLTQRLWNADTRLGSDTNLFDHAMQQNNLNREGWICGVNDRYPLAIFNTAVDWSDLGAYTNPGVFIRPTNTFINPGWVCLGTNYQVITAGITNPMVARYAFWIDAESCKVNVNEAGWRTVSQTNRSDPLDLDLRALCGVFKNATTNLLDAFRSNRPFTTLEETRLRSSSGLWDFQSPTGYASNKFYTTVYGADPNLDVFGRQRLDLLNLTRTNMAVYCDRLDESLYATNVYPNVITDATRSSLGAKYGQLGIRQIMANVLDYQNPYSALPTISDYVTVSHVTNANFLIPAFYAGLKKNPMISEIMVHVATNYPAAGVTSNLDVSVHVNPKLVNGYETARGLSNGVSGILESVVVEGTVGGAATNFVYRPTAEDAVTLTLGVSPNSFAMLNTVAGRPLVFQIPFQGNSDVAVSRVVVNLKRIRLTISTNDASIVDWMTKSDFDQAYPAGMLFTGQWIVAANSLGGALNNAADAAYRPWAVGKHDPRVRTLPGWKSWSGSGVAVPNAAASLSATFENNWSAYAYDQTRPTGDDECSTNFSSRIAPDIYGLLANVRGDPANNGRPSHRFFDSGVRENPMTSVGELSEIHTGYPWRTIRLASVRPFTSGGFGSSTDLYCHDPALTNAAHTGLGDPNTGRESCESRAAPDWLMLDMFCVGSNQMARLNINQLFSGPAQSLAPRREPLMTLIHAADSNLTHSGLSGALAWAADTIATRRFVTNSPYSDSVAVPCYLTPGEICEAEGMAFTSVGETRQPSQRERATLIKRIGNLITTRSDVFSIWIIAENVEDVDRDGRFDWVYERQWRFYDTTVPSTVDPSWWTANVLNSNFIVNAMADGDGDGDGDHTDRVRGRFRIQAVVQRTLHPGADGSWGTSDDRPVYRVLYTRYVTD